jgi:putative MATE family efflux protein
MARGREDQLHDDTDRDRTRSRARDREIIRLAVPAFGALVAEPLYVLADTAIVGHLGRHPLGGLGVAGAILSASFAVFNFLAYGTTAAVARSVGARDQKRAAAQGVAGLWLAIALGLGLMVVVLVFAAPIVDAIGPSAAVRDPALTYLRIGVLGAPFLCIALAGTGYLRGEQNTATPFVIAVAANVLNLFLEIIFVYALHLGIAGSAWGTVIAQAGTAIAYLLICARAARRAHASLRPDRTEIRRAAVVGSHLVVRTGSLVLCFLVATAVASRIDDVAIAAHQVAYQLWLFLALALDAIAIAGQAIVGRTLGANQPAETRASARRMLAWGWWAGVVCAVGIIATRTVLAVAFTHDQAVHSELDRVLWVVALMQPPAAIVFVLDGILIGAGDTRYLAGAMAAATGVFLVVIAFVVRADATLVWLWIALYAFVVARLVGMMWRYLGDKWLVTGK